MDRKIIVEQRTNGFAAYAFCLCQEFIAKAA